MVNDPSRAPRRQNLTHGGKEAVKPGFIKTAEMHVNVKIKSNFRVTTQQDFQS
jgi:hypothetical protein